MLWFVKVGNGEFYGNLSICTLEAESGDLVIQECLRLLDTSNTRYE